MSYKVLLLRDIHESGKILLQKNNCKIVILNSLIGEEYKNELKTCDAIFVRNELITPEIMDLAPNLKVIAKHGTGYDNIDVTYATKKKIQVVYAPNGNIDSVADMTMLHILSCARNINYTQKQLRQGNYNVRFQLMGTHDLKGKTLSLIGCGNIAKQVAKRARFGFDMRVIGYARHIKQDMIDSGIEVMTDRNKVFSEGDFISIHLPSNETTKNSIGKKEFETMKRTAYIINTARGNIICEEDLINALQNKIIAGAGLDVFKDEPTFLDSQMDINHPLLTLDNVYITPHCGGLTVEASQNISLAGAKGILEVLYHKPITWKVNTIEQ